MPRPKPKGLRYDMFSDTAVDKLYIRFEGDNIALDNNIGLLFTARLA